MNKAIHAAFTVLLAGVLAGCSKPTISGMYISQSPREVDMLDIVEAPVGHLSGSLVISTINQDGNRNINAVRNLSGSVYHSNVSLQIGTKGILTQPVNAVGTFRSDEIHLDINGSTQLFKKITKRNYALALAMLDQNGGKVKQVKATLKSMKDFDEYLTQLDTDLQKFVSWGNDRIAHRQNASKWYAGRTLRYQQCVDSARPLALRHVPSWRWQSCVISIDNDSYNRQQMENALEQVQNEYYEGRQSLDARIANLPQQVSSHANEAEGMCSLASSETACRIGMEKLKKGTPSSSLRMHINEYTNILPQLQAAIHGDIQAKEDGEKKLSALANEANNLLHGTGQSRQR